MTDADERRASKALQGLEYPTDKEQILAYAESRQADAKTLRALHALPDAQYADGDEVTKAIPQEPEKQ